MHTTPRLSLQVPDGTDEEETYPAEDAASLTILDNAGLWQSGTLAAKPNPATTIPGTQYYCTDTFALLLCVNGAWIWPFASTELVGTIKHYAGGTVPADPDGVQRWHVADGSAISRTSYPAYYANVGTAWGSGDGSTTVNLPDLRGRALIGAGSGSGLTNRTLAATGGAETVLADLASHRHPVQLADPGHAHGVADPGHGHGVYPTTANNPAGGPASGSAEWTFGSAEYVGAVYTSLYQGNTNNVGTGIGIYGAATGAYPQAPDGGGNNVTSASGNGGGHANLQPFGVATHIVKVS
jgi:microcystin-dependent protein